MSGITELYRNQLHLPAMLRGHYGRVNKDGFKETFQSAFRVGETLDNYFAEAAQTYEIPEQLLKAIAKAESNFDPHATSPKGAQGVMQLMPATSKSLGIEDPYDPRSNIMGGAKHLKEYLDRYEGDVELSLAAYNAGPGNVKKYGGIPPFKETQNYIKKITDYVGGNLNHLMSNRAGQNRSPVTSVPGRLGDRQAEKMNALYLIEMLKLRLQMSAYGGQDPLSLGQGGDLFSSFISSQTSPGIFADRIEAVQDPEKNKYISSEGAANTNFKAVIAEAEKHLGSPYVWGGASPATSFDCSGFITWIFNRSGVHPMSRTTAQGIYNQSKKITPDEVRPGDLIFFKGTYNSEGPVSHIGMITGDNMMIHSGSNGVEYTRTDSKYWKDHFYAVGRL